MTRQGKKQALGIVLNVFAGIFWGLSGSCGQYLFQQKGITSDFLVTVRMLTAGTILVIFSAIKNREKSLDVWRGAKNIKDILIFSIFGMCFSQYSYFTAINYSNAATATVLCYIGPVFIVIFLAIKEKRKPSLLEIISVVLAMLGTFILATRFNFKKLSLSKEALFWGFASGVAYCIYTVQPRRMLEKIDSVTIVGWSMVVGGILMFFLSRSWFIAGHWDIGTYLAMSCIIIFGTILSFCFFFEGVKLIGPVKSSLISCTEPIASAILSFVWLKTPFNYIDIIGMACIITTVFLLSADTKINKRVR